MPYKKSSWKDKVDPAFDKFIKFVLFYLEKTQLPANEGYLRFELPENYIKKFEMEGFPSIAAFYEHDKAEDIGFDFLSMIDDTVKIQEFKHLTIAFAKEVKKDEYALYEIFLEIAEHIQEKDSIDYYLKKYEYLKSRKGYEMYIKKMDEVNQRKWRKEFYSDWQSIQWRYVVIKIEHINKNVASKRNTILRRFSEQPKILKRNIFTLWNTISLLVNKKSMKDLLIEARKGDEEALFKLLKIDKTLFDHDWVRTRIRNPLCQCS